MLAIRWLKLEMPVTSARNAFDRGKPGRKGKLRASQHLSVSAI